MVNEDQFYEKQLGVAYWYVTHKFLLKNILIVVLLSLDILLVAYNIYILSYNLIIRQKDYQAALASFVNANDDYSLLRQFSLPPKIQTASLQTFPNTIGSDIVSEIVNTSPKWYATFDYQFQLGEKSTPNRKGFIFPGETKKLIDLAVADGNLASAVIIRNINWQKEIDFVKLYQEKFRFDIRNVQYIPSKELGLEQKIAVNRVIFEIENLTAYNYKNVNLLIFLNSGGQIIGVNQIPSGILSSGTTKVMEVNFFQPLPKIDSVDIFPEVNILDPAVFLKF
jgi:hypothetical protein